MILFFDTETTGFPLFDQPSEDPRQPHIVQLCAWLVDPETRKTVASIDLIVKPDGWEIPPDVAGIHGITTERAAAVGVPERTALEALLGLWRCASVRIAHNEDFDARIVRIAIKRFAEPVLGLKAITSPLPLPEELADEWKAGTRECTMKLSRPICALPRSKPPKLIEAYQHFFGSDFDGAHTAAGDVAACAAVYWAIKDRQP